MSVTFTLQNIASALTVAAAFSSTRSEQFLIHITGHGSSDVAAESRMFLLTSDKFRRVYTVYPVVQPRFKLLLDIFETPMCVY